LTFFPACIVLRRDATFVWNENRLEGIIEKAPNMRSGKKEATEEIMDCVSNPLKCHFSSASYPE
jgi:hypothetical protein